MISIQTDRSLDSITRRAKIYLITPVSPLIGRKLLL
jgi:hypothetical protein